MQLFRAGLKTVGYLRLQANPSLCTHPLLRPILLAVLEKVVQSSFAQLLSPALEECEVDLVSSHVGRRWEQLAASLGFRDMDNLEFSDCSGEEACQMLLAQWRDEQNEKMSAAHCQWPWRKLVFELLSHSVYSQTAAETHSRTSVMRTN